MDSFRVVAGVGAAAGPTFATQLGTKTNTPQAIIQKSGLSSGALHWGDDMVSVLTRIKTIPK